MSGTIGDARKRQEFAAAVAEGARRDMAVWSAAEVCKAAGYRVVKLEESALPQNSGYFLVTEEL